MKAVDYCNKLVTDVLLFMPLDRRLGIKMNDKYLIFTF